MEGENIVTIIWKNNWRLVVMWEKRCLSRLTRDIKGKQNVCHRLQKRKSKEIKRKGKAIKYGIIERHWQFEKLV